jgi:hypothetical protein
MLQDPRCIQDDLNSIPNLVHLYQLWFQSIVNTYPYLFKTKRTLTTTILLALANSKVGTVAIPARANDYIAIVYSSHSSRSGSVGEKGYWNKSFYNHHALSLDMATTGFHMEYRRCSFIRNSWHFYGKKKILLFQQILAVRNCGFILQATFPSRISTSFGYS